MHCSAFCRLEISEPARKIGLPVLLAALWLALPAPVLAQQKKAAADPAIAQALRKAQGMLQELSEQNAQLGDEVARLRVQVDALSPKTRQLEKAERELALQASATGELREQYRALVERTHRDAARIEELQETGAHLHADNSLLVNAVTEREQWNGDCSKKNAELRQLSAELLDRYRQKGIWQAVKNAEPVTGIAVLAEEREAQAYRFRLEDLSARPVQAATLPGG